MLAVSTTSLSATISSLALLPYLEPRTGPMVVRTSKTRSNLLAPPIHDYGGTGGVSGAFPARFLAFPSTYLVNRALITRVKCPCFGEKTTLFAKLV